MKIHLDKALDFLGFSSENVKGGEGVDISVCQRALLTSDDPEFYQYIEQISSEFLNKNKIQVNSVCEFLILIHQDLSSDLYINDFPVSLQIRAKKDIEAGQTIMFGDIADIHKVKFPTIEIKNTDKVIYCFKIGWRFGLFFDFSFSSQLDVAEKMDIEKMELSIGELRRYLSFYNVYKVLESETQFNAMMKDGWFPFIEIIAGEYKNLSEVYQNRFDFDSRVQVIVNQFDAVRIKKITEKWWKNGIFLDKKELIQPGINAYLQNNRDGFVNCIKNLCTEIEGILRKLYRTETGKADGVKLADLISHIVQKATKSSGSEYSLLLTAPFLKYLQDVVFPKFNVTKGEIAMSRHTSSHGVADSHQYTKERALQLILILDQIYFYSST